MKKTFLLLTILCLALTATACTSSSNQRYYEEAQLYLGSGDPEAAAILFSQLGEYADSADYALYCAALHAMDEGDYVLARVNLENVTPFKSSERFLRYLDALELEEAGNLQAALDIYEALGSFQDSADAAEELREAIPEQTMKEARQLMTSGKYEEARELFLSLEGYGQSALYAENCTVALTKAAYTEADKLCDRGEHLAAMRAFLALGDALDAADRAAQCRATLVAELDKAASQANVAVAEDLIVAYEAIGDEAALAQAAALEKRFGVNLRVLEASNDRPYVLLGSYPTGESGLESPLLWRVMKAEGERLTLLCETVVDASPIATSTDLDFSDAEEAALLSMNLPSVADLAGLEDMACVATPYAVAQGVELKDGVALYWLRDSLESGLHPVVTGNGGLAIPADEMLPGVRPMVTISLADFAFEAGAGTAEDPFR